MLALYPSSLQRCLFHGSLRLTACGNPSYMILLAQAFRVLLALWACVLSPKLYLLLVQPGAHASAAAPTQESWWESWA